MKNILIVSRGIPNGKEPMWGNFELDQAKALSSLGHNVICMSIDQRIGFYFRKIGITKAQVNGIKMYNFFFPLPYRALPRGVKNYIVDLVLKRLYKYIKTHEGSFD